MGRAASGGLDEPLIDRRLESEIKIVECLHRREVRDLEAHRHPGPLLGVHLLPQHAVEKIEIRRLGARRVMRLAAYDSHIPELSAGCVPAQRGSADGWEICKLHTSEARRPGGG